MSVIAVTVLIGLLLVGAGFACERLVERRVGVDFEAPAYALVTGWALLALVGVFCALSGAPLTVPAAAMGAIGVAGYFLAGSGAAAIGRLAFAWLLLLPLIAIASVLPAVMSDEFGYLLPNARTLVENDVFPDSARPNAGSSRPDSPPALSLIGYAAARLGGHEVAVPPKIFTVLLAGGFGLALAQLIAGRLGWLAAIAIGVALASVLNPFFDPRLAFSAHTDTPTGFVLALCVAAAWRGMQEPVPRWPLRAAAAAIVLILLRETNIVLVVALTAGLLTYRRLKLAAQIAAPALMTFGLWRLYLIIAGWPPSVTARPFAQWDWSAPLVVVRSLFIDRLANNPVLAIAGVGIAVAASLLFILVFRSGNDKTRTLVVVAGIVAMTWIVFLAWVYAAVFDAELASIAGSAWRWMTQLGPLLIYVTVASIASLLPEQVAVASPRTATAIGAAACLVPFLAVLGTWLHWRVDCRLPDVVAVRGAAKEIGKLQIGNDRIAVIHPNEPTWYAKVVDYELHRPVRSSRWFKTAEEVPPLPYRLDLSRLDRKELIGRGVPPQIEFARWTGASWSPLLRITPEKLLACDPAGWLRS